MRALTIDGCGRLSVVLFRLTEYLVARTVAGAFRAADARACGRNSIRTRIVQEGGPTQRHLHSWDLGLVRSNLGVKTHYDVSPVIHG